MPNSGYKLVFSYGENSGEAANFEEEVSTLDEDGWKDSSVTKSILQTSIDGIIETIDGTSITIDNSNIASVLNGSVENHYTEWELPKSINIEFGNSESSILSGDDASLVSTLLQWSSSDESVATVSSNGLITAVGYGKATICATDGNKSCSCNVIVPQNATSVELPNLYLYINDKFL